jgi:protein-disulfide isomerase
MLIHRPGVRLRSLGLGLTLLVLMAIGAACAAPQPSSSPSAPTQAGAPTQAAAPQATQPAVVSPTGAAPAQQDSQDPGPSLTKSPAAANTRHFQGDPNAPVVVIEVSDFQ